MRTKGRIDYFKRALREAGGLRGDTITEDADLTVRIQKKGYRVVFNDKMIGFTEAPENLQSFLLQRSRWIFGMMQVLFKHRQIYFRKRFGILTLVILPFTAFVQIPAAIISPIFDIIAILSLIFLHAHSVLNFFLGFLLVFLILSIIAFSFAKEKRFWLLLFLPLYRIYYQALWYFVLYKALFAALKGVFVPWAKLIHYGTVTLGKVNSPAVEAV